MFPPSITHTQAELFVAIEKKCLKYKALHYDVNFSFESYGLAEMLPFLKLSMINTPLHLLAVHFALYCCHLIKTEINWTNQKIGELLTDWHHHRPSLFAENITIRRGSFVVQSTFGTVS